MPIERLKNLRWRLLWVISIPTGSVKSLRPDSDWSKVMQATADAEMAKRMAQQGAGLAVAAKAVGLENHRQMLRDHASRVRDDHRLQMGLLTGTPAGQAESETDEGEDMGDMFICGDIITNPNPSPPVVSMPAPVLAASAPPAPATAPSKLSTAAKAALIGASLLGAGGIAGGALTAINAFNQPPAQEVQADGTPQTHYELHIVE